MEKGVFRAHTYIQVTHDIHPRQASLFLFSVYPFLVGGAANQSFLQEHDGRRPSSLKAVVAVKEEGCRLEGKRWVDRVHEEEGVV